MFANSYEADKYIFFNMNKLYINFKNLLLDTFYMYFFVQDVKTRWFKEVARTQYLKVNISKRLLTSSKHSRMVKILQLLLYWACI